MKLFIGCVVCVVHYVVIENVRHFYRVKKRDLHRTIRIIRLPLSK
jgi:hypothetical protein